MVFAHAQFGTVWTSGHFSQVNRYSAEWRCVFNISFYIVFFFSTQDARRRLSSSFSYRGASIPPDCDCRVWKSNFCLCGGWSIRKNLSRFPDRGELRSMKRLWPSPAPSSFVNIFNNVLLSGQNSLVRLIMKPLFWLWLHHVTDRNCVYQFFHW